MEGDGAAVEQDSTAALAAVLSALAQGADAAQGVQQWNTLVALVGSPSGSIPKLAALRQNPRDGESAEAVARIILTRAHDDPEFRRALGNWRRRKAIQTIARTVTAAHPPIAGNGGAALSTGGSATTAPKPWYRRMPAWVGPAIVGPVIAGTILLFVTGVAGKLFGQSTVSSPTAQTSASPPAQATSSDLANVPESTTAPASSAPASAGSTLQATAPNSPAKVEAVTPLDTAADATYAAAHPIQLTSGQLSQLNADFRSGGTGVSTTKFFSGIHAIPIGTAVTNITVVGNQKTTVTISDLQVVRNCQAPLTGTLFSNPGQGVNGTITLGFDLDSSIYYARQYHYGFHGGDYFRDNVVTLAPGEVRTFDISVETSLHFCQFIFQMTVATPNGEVIENINDNGMPFELTGQASSQAYAAEYVGGVEARVAPSLHDPQGNWVQVNPKNFHV